MTIIDYIITILTFHADAEDFSFTQKVIVFNPDDVIEFANVNVSREGILEDVETFNCVLSVPPEERGVELIQETATVTIIDSDSKYS